ncbi:MAG: hypothetical protein GXZ19_04775, partial [Bacteroidales bacterium]|nr:hypothetical protein [Bacteroidales bacterium]
MRKFIFAAFLFMAVSVTSAWAQQPTELSKEEKEFVKLQETLEKDKEKLQKLYLEKEVLIADKNKAHSEALSAAEKNTQ